MDKESIEIVFKIGEIKVAAKWGMASLVAEPIGDLLLAVELPAEMTAQEADKQMRITLDGIRFIIRRLGSVLIADVDETSEDF